MERTKTAITRCKRYQAVYISILLFNRVFNVFTISLDLRGVIVIINMIVVFTLMHFPFKKDLYEQFPDLYKSNYKSFPYDNFAWWTSNKSDDTEEVKTVKKFYRYSLLFAFLHLISFILM